MTALTDPFPPSVVKWRPGTTTKDKTKALALAYVDARDVMERLDKGATVGWQDSYRLMDDGPAVECTLDVDGIRHADVGYPNGEGDLEPLKGAYSDALKRAAVKFGIGRDLYDTPQFWLPLNQYGRFDATPVFVEGKGWVEPGSPAAQHASSATEKATESIKPDDPMTDAQQKALFAKAGDAGLTKDQFRGMVALVIGKNTLKGATVEQASKVLDKFNDQDFINGIKDIKAAGEVHS